MIPSRLRRHARVSGLARGAAIVFWCVCAVPAQYFGRNKVQYENFDFKVLRSSPFAIHYYPPESLAVRHATSMLKKWNALYDALFEQRLSEPQPVILYADHPDFQQTDILSGLIPQTTGGVTEGLRNRVVVPLTGVSFENDHVLGHELVHAYHYTIMKSLRGGLSTGRNVPLWFIEGMAEYLSVRPRRSLTAMWMRDAVIRNDIPTLREMSRDPRYFPYRFGHAVWAYIAAKWGNDVVPRLFRAVLKDGPRAGIRTVLGVESDSLSSQWRNAVRNHYAVRLRGRINPSGYGTPLVSKANMNLAPSVSPDGKYVTFYSSRDVFTLSMYLAEVKTGKVLRKLVDSRTSSHFDALRFSDCPGAWSPDSRRVAFVVFADGDNTVAILDVEAGTIEKLPSRDEFEAIRGVAWSPDGSRLALSVTRGGISDLYLYDLETDSVRALTDGPYAELQPAWSPDGGRLVFLTDRPLPPADSGFHPLSRTTLAIRDMKSGTVSRFSCGDYAMHNSPRFSSDGRGVYVVANPDGYSDIYRLDLADTTWHRVTSIATGVSGLTPLSPSLSVARDSDLLVFNAFDNRGYDLYSLAPTRVAAEPFESDSAAYAYQVSLPPLSPEKDQEEDIASEVVLVPAGIDTVTPYRPELGLLYIGRIAVGATVNEFGTGLAGGANMVFSDMLGEHVLGIGAQVNGSLKDAGGRVLYRNRTSRWVWGVGGSHTPLRTSRSSSRRDTLTTDTSSTPVTTVEVVEQRSFLERGRAVVEYPFDRNRRLEFSPKVTRLWHTARARRVSFDDGREVSREDVAVDAPSPLTLAEGAVAFVGDFSVAGFTAPVDGRRYRVELEPAGGTLRFLSVLADYRHYIRLHPVTLAFRGVHYGRYLRDAESARLPSLSLSYPQLLRGYEVSSYDASVCMEEEDECSGLEKLFGSRLAILNAEVRAPLIGTGTYGLIDFRFLPVTVAAFLEGGVAWTSEEWPEPELSASSKERTPVFSGGAAARVNVLGALVVQFYYAYPFQRPQKGAHFGFALGPGF